MITLVLGGARSGKSESAERRATETGAHVTYVATAQLSLDDLDLAERIRRHKERRSKSWATVELGPGGDLAGTLRSIRETALVDSLGTWVAGAPQFGVVPATLLGSLHERAARSRPTILVSDEVGLGVHPETEAGRSFRDALGELNRAIAEVADEVLLVVAGRLLSLGRDELADASGQA
ncbi:MAG: bifunctional adenosylcobinamide kinase/adenosylcobinamide-phosphate guanylyltransferase [Acidimicrobiales bacterium]